MIILLAQLKIEHASLVLKHCGQRQRQQRQKFAIAASHHQRIIAPALYLNHGQRGATFTDFSAQGDLVTQVITDQRLHMIGQVGQQRGT